MSKHKIYIFNNGGQPGWMSAVAIGDTGHVVSGHICSSEGFMQHDMGITSDWKHDDYNAQYGEGNWELEWVPTEQVKASSHAGLEAAIKENANLPKLEAKPKNQPCVEIVVSD